MSDFIVEKGVLDQKEKDILTEIDKLPSKPVKQDNPKREDNVQENNVAELDDETYTVLFKGIASGKTVVADENCILRTC